MHRCVRSKCRNNSELCVNYSRKNSFNLPLLVSVAKRFYSVALDYPQQKGHNTTASSEVYITCDAYSRYPCRSLPNIAMSRSMNAHRSGSSQFETSCCFVASMYCDTRSASCCSNPASSMNFRKIRSLSSSLVPLFGLYTILAGVCQGAYAGRRKTLTWLSNQP